jgi:hypothetical protein
LFVVGYWSFLIIEHFPRVRRYIVHHRTQCWNYSIASIDRSKHGIERSGRRVSQFVGRCCGSGN